MITCGNITLVASQSLQCKSVRPCSWMICHVANIHYTIARHYNIVILRRICQWLSVVRVDHHRYNCVLLSQYVLDLVVNCLRQAFPRQALATRY